MVCPKPDRHMCHPLSYTKCSWQLQGGCANEAGISLTCMARLPLFSAGIITCSINDLAVKISGLVTQD